jgi:hypothetical protein
LSLYKTKKLQIFHCLLHNKCPNLNVLSNDYFHENIMINQYFNTNLEELDVDHKKL